MASAKTSAIPFCIEHYLKEAVRTAMGNENRTISNVSKQPVKGKKQQWHFH